MNGAVAKLISKLKNDKTVDSGSIGGMAYTKSTRRGSTIPIQGKSSPSPSESSGGHHTCRTKPDECAWLGWREANGTWVLYSMRGDPTASTGNEDVPFGVDTVKHPCRDWACPPNNPNLGSGGTPKCSRMQYCWKATAYQATRSQGLAGHPQNSHGMVAAPPSPAPHVPDWS